MSETVQVAPVATRGRISQRSMFASGVRALAIKELREASTFTVVALLAYAWLVASETGWMGWMLSSGQPERMPFVGRYGNDSFEWFFILISLCFCVAMGLRQTVGESISGTYPLLLHRPLPWSVILGVKLAVGLALYAVCAALPILAYGLWAALPGTHPAPFQWSMTEPAWVCWLVMPLMYLGAFLTGIRPGRWFGTRLLPLLSACLVCYVLGMCGAELSLWYLTGFLAAWPAWIVAILWVARTRDF